MTNLGTFGLPVSTDFVLYPRQRKPIFVISRWAAGLYALRAAERVRPLFLTSECPPETMRFISVALEGCRDAVTTGGRGRGYLKDLALSAHVYVKGRPRAPLVGQCLAHLLLYMANGLTDDIVNSTLWGAAILMSVGGDDALGGFRDACWHDHALLKAATEREGWDERSPVPLDAAGPLWPAGTPAWTVPRRPAVKH